MVYLRSIAPPLTRITIAGAIGAAFHIGQGNCDLTDGKAVEFSRTVLEQTDIDGEIIACKVLRVSLYSVGCIVICF